MLRACAEGCDRSRSYIVRGILHDFIIEQSYLSVVLLDLSLDLAVQSLQLLELRLPAWVLLGAVHSPIDAVGSVLL